MGAEDQPLLQVGVACWDERLVVRQATKHLCVSKAMQHFLQSEWGITATVFYDTPPAWFHRLTLPEKHDFFNRFAADLKGPMHMDGSTYQSKSKSTQPSFDFTQDYKVPEASEIEHNIFSFLEDGQPELKMSRPALIVSSTSWTVDEDFGILLNAAIQYEKEVGPATSTC